MSTRAQNENKFGQWDELPGGSRRYQLDVPGQLGWLARYLKPGHFLPRLVPQPEVERTPWVARCFSPRSA